MTDRAKEELDALLDRITAITGHPYASRGQCLLNCDLGVITLGDVADLCAAIADLRATIDQERAATIEAAADACDAVKREARDLNMGQIAMGAMACRDAIRALHTDASRKAVRK